MKLTKNLVNPILLSGLLFGVIPTGGCSHEKLQPVRAFIPQGVFSIPGCGSYDQKFPPHSSRMVVWIPTAQEAKLAGFRPAANCPGIDERFAKEKEFYGEIGPSADIDKWHNQLVMARQVRDAEDRADELDEQQQELQEKQDELEQKQQEIDDKLGNP